jgi:hypothetical protein
MYYFNPVLVAQFKHRFFPIALSYGNDNSDTFLISLSNISFNICTTSPPDFDPLLSFGLIVWKHMHAYSFGRK